MSGYESVDRIRRSHRYARPNPSENPAWANCHMDCGILLERITSATADEGYGVHIMNPEPHREPPMIIENLACDAASRGKDWDCGHVNVGYTHEQLLKSARDLRDQNRTYAILLLEIERLRDNC